MVWENSHKISDKSFLFENFDESHFFYFTSMHSSRMRTERSRGVLVLLKLCGAPGIVEFVLGRFSLSHCNCLFRLYILWRLNSQFFVENGQIFSKTSTLQQWPSQEGGCLGRHTPWADTLCANTPWADTHLYDTPSIPHTSPLPLDKMF